MRDLDGVALALANAYNEASFEGLATYDAVADSESIRLGHRVRPQAKDMTVGMGRPRCAASTATGRPHARQQEPELMPAHG